MKQSNQQILAKREDFAVSLRTKKKSEILNLKRKRNRELRGIVEKVINQSEI